MRLRIAKDDGSLGAALDWDDLNPAWAGLETSAAEG